ncbi:efflux RND transporter periplasmic adaptor subunit [Elizabethkingia anophelis]|uniref:efflux RND transporter periplasmic adaptor subunit n=1 Tax=Elizabethkingia anophelis TaxID=1117645 RepID=UPI0012B3E7E1|nr:efflux RND transporter periplasmic adaptor subunit [Elizabethkingia anophelis]QGN22545.1 efflux RND transporter periplasmic adaptor subunit [Elizabethkingia anophelis]QNV09197.1 efflux RND transporter periplasmic adaptor subunit [Elizabethkingia anophelis]UTF90953.1 efflux RND transporter periplasmic adaptor subunit [Elizabethkingia anophelis]UTG01823.1 efflux RND transporter periplasmic adaptor subunit [Elizabethkingia anophelis]UTG05573.1 efflux RND transporter periplasmic adaptor subunit
MERRTLIKQNSWILIALISGLSMVGCKNNSENTQENQQQEIEAEVLTLKLESANVEQSYPTSLEGKVNVDIRPQVSGYLDKIYVDEGAFVKAGQPLFKINESVYREQRNTALSALDAAKAQLQSAKLELEKYEVLSQNKVVADFQYQKAKAAYESSKSAVDQQKTLVAASELNMGFTLVKAPVSGYVGRIPKRLGNLVSPTDQQALTTLSQVDEVYAYFSVPENEILNINDSRQGRTLLEKLQTFKNVVLKMANGNNYKLTGKIDMMDGQFDKGTGSVTVRASFPNPEGLLRSGNTGRVLLTTEQNNIFKIPVLATYEMQDKLFVGKVEKNGMMNRTELKDYIKSGDFFIVKEGFHAGDQIVANELGSIPEKAKIKPKKLK